MSVNDVKATFREGNRLASQGMETLIRAADQAVEAATLVQHTIHDSRDRDAEAVAEKLRDVAREVEVAIRRFDAAVENVEDYIKALG
ncbi:hypothetical protein ACWDV4_22320 [Micromonospora sp. NPDC003197]